MAKIRSAEDLVDVVQADAGWRKKEMSQLMLILERNKAPDGLGLRAIPVLFYAHWEGFVRAAGEAYLQFVAKQGIAGNQIAAHLVAYQIECLVETESPMQRCASWLSLAETLRSAKPLSVRWRHGIDTKSNLNSTVLSRVVVLLGISPDLFQAKLQFLDKVLLPRRNAIAHGRRVVPDIRECREIHDSVIELVETFANLVMNAATTGQYKL